MVSNRSNLPCVKFQFSTPHRFRQKQILLCEHADFRGTFFHSWKLTQIVKTVFIRVIFPLNTHFTQFSFMVCLSIVTLILIATFRPHTAGLHQAKVSNYLYHRGCLSLIDHKSRSWLVGFDPKYCWHCESERKELISRQSAVVKVACHVV